MKVLKVLASWARLDAVSKPRGAAGVHVHRGRGLDDRDGQLAAPVVLGEQGSHGVGECPGPLQAREDVSLLDSFVESFDVVVHHLRGVEQRRRVEQVTGAESAPAFPVDQQDAFEQAVIGH